MAVARMPWRACIVLLAAAPALAACTSTARPLPELPAPQAAFRHAPSAAPATAAPLPGHGWWTVFDDPVLDQLQASAARGNTGIQGAAARLAKARALVRDAQAARAPQLSLRAAAGRQGGPIVNAAGGEGTLLTVDADFSWETDLFGQLRQALDAQELDAQAQEALLRDAQLLVQASVAETYLAVRAVDGERALLQAAADASRETVAITEGRWRAGSVAELDLVRARTELAAIESDSLALQRRRAQLEHALAVLTGANASGFELPQRDWEATAPPIPAGVPAAALARRPDVAAARRGLEAAQARLGLARSTWLPSLAFTTSGGGASPNLGNLLRAAMRTWSVGALLGITLLDGGRREAGIAVADAELEAAAAAYREQLLQALREVEDQLVALQWLASQGRTQAAAVELGERAALLAESRQRSGLASQLDLLDARRTALRLQRDALQVRAAQLQATVRLIRALGGGWQVADSPGRP